jgi:hypothetical protein
MSMRSRSTSPTIMTGTIIPTPTLFFGPLTFAMQPRGWVFMYSFSPIYKKVPVCHAGLSHCELEPCLVGGWERGRIAGCLGVGITAGWGETEVSMEVSSRRLAIVQHCHLPAHGLLSLISLLSAFLLTGIKRNRVVRRHTCCSPVTRRRSMRATQARAAPEVNVDQPTPKAASKLSHEARRSSKECVGSHESHRPNYESSRFVVV